MHGVTGVTVDIPDIVGAAEVSLILVAFGSGPVRGFGVTLAIGIVASAFTATTVTRYLVAGWLRWLRPTAIPI